MESGALVIDHLRVGYGRNEVVHEVSITAAAGARTALLGANGAGKTTILRTVSGLLRATSGSITFAGTSLIGMSPAAVVRHGVVQVPEGRRIFPSLSVEENLKVAHQGRPEADLAAGLERVYGVFPALVERRQHAAGLLSGGQQQMVALGRAIIAEPRLLLLDEMSLGLAPILVKDFYARLNSFFPEGLTILVVEQNARLALDVCDYVYVLRNGSVALHTKAEELRASPHLLHESYLGVRAKQQKHEA